MRRPVEILNSKTRLTVPFDLHLSPFPIIVCAVRPTPSRPVKSWPWTEETPSWAAAAAHECLAMDAPQNSNRIRNPQDSRIPMTHSKGILRWPRSCFVHGARHGGWAPQSSECCIAAIATSAVKLRRRLRRRGHVCRSPAHAVPARWLRAGCRSCPLPQTDPGCANDLRRMTACSGDGSFPISSCGWRAIRRTPGVPAK